MKIIYIRSLKDGNGRTDGSIEGGITVKQLMKILEMLSCSLFGRDMPKREELMSAGEDLIRESIFGKGVLSSLFCPQLGQSLKVLHCSEET